MTFPRQLLLAALSALAPCAAQSQCPDSGRSRYESFIVLGSHGEDQQRLAALRGCTPWTLIRSPLALSATLPSDGLSLELVYPRVQATRNSAMPFSMNDGARWAGRGWSSTTTLGARLRWGRIVANFVPEMIRVENEMFPIVVAPDSAGRSRFINPFHFHGRSIDAPLRFGYDRYTMVTPGQSVIEVQFDKVAVGASTENLWWGPGLRTAIVMSNNAAGIPQLYVRTPRPVSTPFGSFEARLLLGILSESRFFDDAPGNDHRSLSGAVATWTAPFDSGLTLGASRVVYANLSGYGALPGHIGNFARVLPSNRRDEMSSIFGRWAVTQAGLALHWELARLRLPSLRGMLLDPQDGQGYNVGLEWATELERLSALLRTPLEFRVQMEGTMLEQAYGDRTIEPPGYYTSRRVPQGYTQRGEVIGAATGSGSSSQWLTLGLFERRASLGLILGRIRWENEAYYQTSAGLKHFTHDVSLLKGLKGSVSLRNVMVNAEITKTKRLNSFFQTAVFGDYWHQAFDVYNYTLNVGASYSR